MPRSSGGGMHYTKSGNLDMRYSSSKAYVASSGGGGGSSYSGGGGGYSSYGGGSSGGGDLHYTKSGNLDMRYSSSKAAMSSSSGYCSASPASGSSSYGGGGDGLHYTKSGNLDMRYSSSKAAMNSSSGYCSGSPASGSSSRGDAGLHYTKSGNLDMRYASSKEAVGGGRTSSGSGLSGRLGGMRIVEEDLHYTKSGGLDMRYASSKAAVGGYAGCKTGSGGNRVPAHIPRTKNGLPDMRTKAAKEWVAKERVCFNGTGNLPSWLPKRKDGGLDMQKNIVRHFFDKGAGQSPPPLPAYQPDIRIIYYKRRCEDAGYMRQLACTRREYVPPATFHFPSYYQSWSRASRQFPTELRTVLATEMAKGHAATAKVPSHIPVVKYTDMEAYFTEEKKLGAGGFGTVYKGRYEGKTVAVKKLLMEKIPKHGKAQFMVELQVMASFTDHTNLVKLLGYTLEPGCLLVMEYVKLGSLSYLIHHAEDIAIEAKISDGRIKKRLVCGIVNGMIQLHAAGIIHRDLKPANVLVTEDYTAKIADFGFSTLRGRAASLSAQHSYDQEDNAIAGTAGYMAPELLDVNVRSDFPVDVYAFAVVMNEIVHEEEPYADCYAEAHARGPFGAAYLAQAGKRPVINKDKVPANVVSLITKCWSQSPKERPSFLEIAETLNESSIVLPNFVGCGASEAETCFVAIER